MFGTGMALVGSLWMMMPLVPIPRSLSAHTHRGAQFSPGVAVVDRVGDGFDEGLFGRLGLSAGHQEGIMSFLHEVEVVIGHVGGLGHRVSLVGQDDPEDGSSVQRMPHA